MSGISVSMTCCTVIPGEHWSWREGGGEGGEKEEGGREREGGREGGEREGEWEGGRESGRDRREIEMGMMEGGAK